MQAYMSQMTEEQILQQFSQSLKAQTTEATFEGNKEKLGITNEDNRQKLIYMLQALRPRKNWKILSAIIIRKQLMRAEMKM